MSIVIDGITLDHDLDWSDEFKWVPSTGDAARTLNGEYVAQAFPLIMGRPMTLTGDANHGWQKRSTVDSLRALVSTRLYDSFVVVYNSRSFVCAFRHNESPAVDFVPVVYNTNPDNNFWYTGSIKLVILAVQ